MHCYKQMEKERKAFDLQRGSSGFLEFQSSKFVPVLHEETVAAEAKIPGVPSCPAAS